MAKTPAPMPMSKSAPKSAPDPRAGPAQPKGVGCLRVLKHAYRTWIAAGGTPPIYH